MLTKTILRSTLIRKPNIYVPSRLLKAKLCYDIIACPECGEWLDKSEISAHECRKVVQERGEEEIRVGPPEIAVIATASTAKNLRKQRG